MFHSKIQNPGILLYRFFFLDLSPQNKNLTMDYSYMGSSKNKIYNKIYLMG
jgi:hypothetical protein